MLILERGRIIEINSNILYYTRYSIIIEYLGRYVKIYVSEKKGRVD